MSHGLHVLLSIASLGLWLVPYVAVWIHRSRTIRWRCTHCGHRFRINGQRNGAPGEPKPQSPGAQSPVPTVEVQSHEIPPPHAHSVPNPSQPNKTWDSPSRSAFVSTGSALPPVTAAGVTKSATVRPVFAAN